MKKNKSKFTKTIYLIVIWYSVVVDALIDAGVLANDDPVDISTPNLIKAFKVMYKEDAGQNNVSSYLNMAYEALNPLGMLIKMPKKTEKQRAQYYEIPVNIQQKDFKKVHDLVIKVKRDRAKDYYHRTKKTKKPTIKKLVKAKVSNEIPGEVIKNNHLKDSNTLGLQLLNMLEIDTRWIGNSKDLLDRLEYLAPPYVATLNNWPKSINMLEAQLNNQVGYLAKKEYTISWGAPPDKIITIRHLDDTEEDIGQSAILNSSLDFMGIEGIEVEAAINDGVLRLSISRGGDTFTRTTKIT